MAKQDWPSWVEVGARVWIQPDSYSSIPSYRAGTITRMTASSVWAKTDGGKTEYRFAEVVRPYSAADFRLREYGKSTGWRSVSYLHALDSKTVSYGLRASRLQDDLLAAITATRDFGVHESQSNVSRKERAEKAIAALRKYLFTLAESDGRQA